MRALVEAVQEGRISADVHKVISPILDSPAASWAVENGLELAVVPAGEGYVDRLLAELRGATILALAGYTRLLPVEVLHLLPGRVLNIHPAFNKESLFDQPP